MFKWSRFEYQWFTSSGFKDIGIRKFEFVAKTQFLCLPFPDFSGSLCISNFYNYIKSTLELRMFNVYLTTRIIKCLMYI